MCAWLFPSLAGFQDFDPCFQGARHALAPTPCPSPARRLWSFLGASLHFFSLVAQPRAQPPLHPIPLLSFQSFSLHSWFVDIHAGVLISVWHIHLLLPFLQALGKAELSHCFHPILPYPIPSHPILQGNETSVVTSVFLGSDLKLSFSVPILSTLRYRLPRLQIWFSLFIFFLRIIIHFFHFPCCLHVFCFIRFYGFAALADALFRMSLV